MDVIKDWPEFRSSDHEELHQVSTETLLGRLEIISGKILQYTYERNKRLENDQLQRIFEESEEEERRIQNSDFAGKQVNTTGRIIVTGNEHLLDSIQLDQPDETEANKPKVLDLLKLRKLNMNIFYESMNAGLKSHPTTTKKSVGNMSTTHNLNSDVAINRIGVESLEFTGFTERKLSTVNKSNF